MIYTIGPGDKWTGSYINVVSHDAGIGRELSPFLLGPVELYGGYVAENVENGWQFAKVYMTHTKDGEPTEAYWNWAKKGWADRVAHRYPMGKLSIPMYSLWDGQKLDYIEARKKIYLPLYAKAARKTDAYALLEGMAEGQDICLFDYDSYNIETRNKTIEQALDDKTRHFGHGMVLKMMLEGKL